ncbi:MAG TPA: hypothetical protein VM238_22945 [Phycisphaerae bacterium]|nr:hypothetical protein [Phycisphaerae bacterium]
MTGGGIFGMIVQAIGIGVTAAGENRAGDERYEAHIRTAKDYGREQLWSREDTDYRVRMVREAGAETVGAIEAETGKAGLAMTGTPLSHLVATAGKIEMSVAGLREAQRRTDIRYARAIDEERAQARKERSAGHYRSAAAVIGGIGEMGSSSGMMG